MDDLSRFCCQNKECADYGKRGIGNLTVCGHFGKNQRIRLLYCRTCKDRFSERKGTPLFGARLDEKKIVSVLAPDDPADAKRGDDWDHVAFDPVHRLVVSVIPGKRTAQNVEALVEDFKARTGGRMMDLIVTDEYPAYEVAILNAYGQHVSPPPTGKPGRPRGPRMMPPEDLLYATRSTRLVERGARPTASRRTGMCMRRNNTIDLNTRIHDIIPPTLASAIPMTQVTEGASVIDRRIGTGTGPSAPGLPRCVRTRRPVGTVAWEVHLRRVV